MAELDLFPLEQLVKGVEQVTGAVVVALVHRQYSRGGEDTGMG